MFLDKFIREYRDYLSASQFILDHFPQSLNRFERKIVDDDMISKLEEFQTNLSYLEENTDLILQEIDSIYDKVDSKLDKLVDISEGFQRLNTKDLAGQVIRNFQIFSLKDKDLYDRHLDGIALKRNTSVKRLAAISKERASKGAVERFRIPSGKVELLGRVIVPDEANTVLKRVVCVSKDGVELLSTTRDHFEIPVETHDILITTDNIDPDRVSYTTLELLKNTFGSTARMSLEDKKVRKEGDRLKLVIDKEIPTDCYITGHLTLRTKTSTEVVYFNLGYGKKVLVPYDESKGEVEDLYKNKVTLNSSEEKDLVLSNEWASNPDVIKHLGQGVFDISNVNATEFNITLSFYLYSMVNNTKTPVIKSVFCYVS